MYLEPGLDNGRRTEVQVVEEGDDFHRLGPAGDGCESHDVGEVDRDTLEQLRRDHLPTLQLLRHLSQSRSLGPPR